MSPRLDANPILIALEKPITYVKTETKILGQGFQPTASDVPGQNAFQVTYLSLNGSVYRTIDELRGALAEVVVITDFDSQQQEKLERSLNLALLDKSEAWRLDDLVCQGGCVFLHFPRAGYTYDPAAATEKDYEHIGTAMVNEELDNYRFIFQSGVSTGIVIDYIVNDDKTITTTAYTVQDGAITQRLVNVFDINREEETLRPWDISYTS